MGNGRGTLVCLLALPFISWVILATSLVLSMGLSFLIYEILVLSGMDLKK